MPVCQSCLSAIEKVYAHGPNSQLNQHVTIQFPVLTQCHIRNCWVCLKFSEWLESEDPSLFDSWKTNPLSVKFFYSAQIGDRNRANIPLRVFLGIQLDYSDPDDDDSCLVDLAFIQPKDLEGRIGTKPTIPAPGSLDLSLLKEWIDTCRKSHKQCGEKKENWHPTRLLHITSGGQQVRLVISQDHAPKGYYITLSHRWGECPYTKLETSTMAQLQRVVDVPDLPPAFQDAIRIAAFLDIQYLWIDGLCIKQDRDDRSDWEIESLTMGKVYANAFLNVSATLAVDGSEALFHNQGWGPIGPSEIKLKINGRTELFYILDGEIWEDEISNAPLNNRGWVFQERFLAQRVLHCGTRQLGWECRQLTALAMFPKGLPANLGTPIAKSSFYARLAKVARHTRRRSVQDWLNTWHSIVEAYSLCLLTYTKDKLIAFAGIGASLSEFIGTEFVAGMLAESLIYDLAWWRWSEDRTRSPLGDTSLRAPSWSWMSVDGKINFPEDLSGIKRARKFVENIEIIREDDDLTGKHGLLRLRGVCMPLRAKWSEGVIVSFSLSELSACRFTVDDGPRGSSIYYEITIEEMRDLEIRGRILLLPLFSTPAFFNGILITSNRGRSSYRRIGVVNIPVHLEWASDGDGEKEMDGEETHLEQWRRDTRVRDKNFTTVWNYTAIRLVDYIQGSTSRVIEIS
ncbi:HET-domain-containing protein [Stipitochalara longipes BDJ]|nr:HET-domain-containing protein [Stipitochalara longipes BDJ]